MPARTRKVRGSRTQALVAEWYQRLWPAAAPAGAGAAGPDILNVPLDIEVKGRREFRPLEWIRQLRQRRKDGDVLPGHVVMRPDGLGEASIGDWLVIRPLSADTDLLAELLDLRKLLGSAAAVYRRDALEYADRNGGLMSAAARAELEELRRSETAGGTQRGTSAALPSRAGTGAEQRQVPGVPPAPHLRQGTG